MRVIEQIKSYDSVSILHRESSYIPKENKPQFKRLHTLLMNEFILREKEGNAVGLALNQLNSPYNGFIFRTNSGVLTVIFNARLVGVCGNTNQSKEGCLSVKKGKKTLSISRYNKVTIEYYDWKEDKMVLDTFKGKEAIIIQHELDHLNGISILKRKESQNEGIQSD